LILVSGGQSAGTFYVFRRAMDLKLDAGKSIIEPPFNQRNSKVGDVNSNPVAL